VPQQAKQRSAALAAAMAIPGRNSSAKDILNPTRTFFATTKTAMGKQLLQSELNAELMIDVLRSLVAERAFELLDFVIMPDHLHLVLSVGSGMTIERAMQLVKGRFSRRLSKELGFSGEVWQRGFSEEQVLGRARLEKSRKYIADNPVKAGLAKSSGEYPYCFASLAKRKSEARGREQLQLGD
jgi:putative transposase